jgi:septal ring factor EnvC (AmiA/AmiB activator)
MDQLAAGPPSQVRSPFGDPGPTAPEASLAAQLHQTELALAAASGEAKGLLIAAEMAERASAAIWEELRFHRSNRADLEYGLEMLELSLADAKAATAEANRQLADTQASLAAAEAATREVEQRLAATEALLSAQRARLAETLNSHSWRLTAPVRWLSGRLLRRP